MNYDALIIFSHYQLSHFQTMRNYEFVCSIKSRDIKHSIALFLKNYCFLKPILKCFKSIKIPRDHQY
jgi:hypothetical protein